jgi:alkylhydroperoxidase family enzyme
MTRIPLVSLDTEDERLRAVFDTITAQRRPVPNLYRALGNAPSMLRAWTSMAWPLRLSAESAPRWLRELLILRVAQLTDAQYEWIHHRNMGLENGLSEEQIVGLTRWRDEPVFDELSRACLEATEQLTITGRLTDDAFDQLARFCDPPMLVEVILTVAFYCCVSRVLHAFEIDVEAGAAQ